MSKVKSLAKHWNPVQVPDSYGDNITDHGWSKDALKCLELNRICQFCPIHINYGLIMDLSCNRGDKSRACKMPLAVQDLLDRQFNPKVRVERKVRANEEDLTVAKRTVGIRTEEEKEIRARAAETLAAWKDTAKALAKAASEFTEAVKSYEALFRAEDRVDYLARKAEALELELKSHPNDGEEAPETATVAG